jgi:hypothetical protein
MSKTPNGIVIYRGPSMLDGAPIVVIATGLAKTSRNDKTGELIQTWILRENVSPADAVNSGQDSSICGACPHRGAIVDGKNVGRSCYVTIWQAPRNTWETYHRGKYPIATVAETRALFAGKRVRLGAYGDPAAVPFNVWEEVLAEVKAKTGYTHQWRTCDARFARFVMASCDTPQDYVDAKNMGYRTFRVRAADEPLNIREIVCPASKEAGYKTNCAACLACGGSSAKARVDIAIVAHGSAALVNNYAKARLAA